jgi:hypothetical protein
MALGGLRGASEGSDQGEGNGLNLGQIWKPRPLSWEPPKHPGIDDLDRHLRARGRLSLLVAELTRRYHREFPAYKYKLSAADSHREMAALLRQFGGLPATAEFLNEVPAAVLEEAVEAFGAYFGLGQGASGHPAGATSTPSAELDPPPSQRRKDVEAAPW